MIDLIKLELKKNNIHTYIHSVLIITAIMLIFLYMFAIIPYIEPNSAEAALFENYLSIFGIVMLINMVAFAVLSSVMYSKFVIDEYIGRSAILLFSYPISRKKVFLAKIIFVSVFIIIGLSVSNIIIFFIFSISETVYPLVKDTLTLELLISNILVCALQAVIAAGVGTISMAIGFYRKSVPITIVSAVILCSLISNVASTTGTSLLIVRITVIIVVLISIVVVASLLGKISHMEA